MNESADILLDNLRHPEIYWHGKLFVTDPFMQWAIWMLNLISKKEWWEDSEQIYYEEFIAKYKPLWIKKQ